MYHKNAFRWVIVLCSCLQVVSCAPQPVTTTWKSSSLPFPERKTDQILVIGIIGDTGTTLRWEVESNLAELLNKSGYRAASSLTLLGRDGMKQVGKEELWRSLCSQGFDAVVTLALIDKNRETGSATHKMTGNAAAYYYDRVTRYRHIVADLTATEQEASGTAYWEVMVFDLFDLVPLGVLRSKAYHLPYAVDLHAILPALVIKRLKKEKMLDGSRR